MELLITVTTVGVMLLYSAPGFALVKAKKIQPSSISALATVLMYICQSCLVVYSFQKVTYTRALFINMVIFFVLAVAIQGVLLGTYYLLFRKKYNNVRYRIATIAGAFGNCAFMGVPLLEHLLPHYPTAVVFSAVYSISMNLLGWTIASAVIANDKKYIKPKNFFLNPSMIALYIALPLFFTHTYIGGNVFGDAVFLLAKMIYPLTTPTMINDFKACGGFILLATGLRIAKIKEFPIADMIPAMILVMPISAFWVNCIVPML